MYYQRTSLSVGGLIKTKMLHTVGPNSMFWLTLLRCDHMLDPEPNRVILYLLWPWNTIGVGKRFWGEGCLDTLPGLLPSRLILEVEGNGWIDGWMEDTWVWWHTRNNFMQWPICIKHLCICDGAFTHPE